MDESDAGAGQGEREISRSRRSGIEEEQALCSDAVESGDYDKFSDAAWIKLCEDVAAKSRDQENAVDK